MEHTNYPTAMLDLITRPAFCVKDGIIVGVNNAGQQHHIETGTAVSKILHTGITEYSDFTEGCLYLSLTLSNVPCGASVTRIDGFDIFLLEEEEDQTQLQGLALAAQELRQPLSNVMTIAENLFPVSEADMPPQLQDHVSRINRGLFQMLRIISNMSDAYRYNSQCSAYRETRDICAFLEEQFRSAQPLMQYADLTLNYTGPKETIYCFIDSEKLERAVSNLLSNAMKFSSKGDVIDVSLTRKGSMLYLCVRDSGSGVEEGIRKNLYNRFRREPGIEDSRHGIGLGMVLIRSAATAHGGTVLMEQCPDGGTKLTMTIPIRQSGDAPLRSHIFQIDYAGERDHRLLELSDCLPADLYKNKIL